MIYLILAIICSSSLALILKHGNVKNSNIILLINANYLTATVFALAFIIYKGGFHFSLYATLFAIGLGVLFAETFCYLFKSYKFSGNSTSNCKCKIIRFNSRAFFDHIFRKSPNIKMIFGFVAAIITLYLFYLSLKNHGTQKVDKVNTFIYFLF